MAGETKKDIGTCSRCGREHGEIMFKKLAKPIQLFEDTRVRKAAFFSNPSAIMYTHWAPCPTTGEPILMRLFAGPSCCVGGKCQSRRAQHREAEPEQPVKTRGIIPDEIAEPAH